MSEEVEVEVIEEEIADSEPILSENGAAAEDVQALASAVAAKATEEAFIEVPIMGAAGDEEGGKEDEKTEDQVTEIEEDKQNMGARQASLEEVHEIPVESEDIVEASIVEDIEEPAAAPEQEPPAEEAVKQPTPPPEPSSPTVTRKKVTIEESPPASPIKKDGSASPTRKEPSWWKKGKKDEEEEVIEEAETVEEQKSKSEEQPVPPSEPEPEPEPEPVKHDEPTPAPEPEPEPQPEPEPEVEVEPEPAHEEPAKPVQEEFYAVPMVVEETSSAPEPASEPAASKIEEERSTVVLESVEEEPEKIQERHYASPPRERQSRLDKAEEARTARAVAAAEYGQPAPTPITRTPTYITYSSWAPPTDYRSTYIPTYSSYVRPSAYYQTIQYSSTYTRPMSPYVRTFDNYVRTGAFGQSSYAADRLRTRSRSRERSRYSSTGYYTPPPLRQNREYSLPSRFAQASGPPSAAPSRSGSFVNFMDYVVTTDRNLRRSASRSSSVGIEEATLSRSGSRTILPTPADTINHWYSKQIAHVDNYVRRLNEVYDNNVYGYSSRYNTSRPYTGYLTAGLGDYPTYNRSLRGYSSDLERRLHTHKTYLRAIDLTRLPKTAAHQTTMKRSVFW